MALKIRLSRAGAKKRPFYRIVVADSRRPRDGRFIERLGTYDPMLKRDDPNRIKLNEERIRHWLSVGAQPTDRVTKFLGAAEIVATPSFNNPQKAKPRTKTQERLKAAAEAAAAAADAPAETPTEDTPAEEATASVEEKPTSESVMQNTPVEDATAGEPQVERVAPQEATSVKDAPASDEGPEEEAPAEDTPAADEAATVQASAEETPAEEPPTEEPPAVDEVKEEKKD